MIRVRVRLAWSRQSHNGITVIYIAHPTGNLPDDVEQICNLQRFEISSFARFCEQGSPLPPPKFRNGQFADPSHPSRIE